MRFEELSYEEKRKFRYELQDYMLEFYKYKSFSGKRVLEVGCGAGIDSCEFASNGAIITSVDFTEIAAKLTMDLTKKYGGQVARCSATILPFREEVFDVVYSFGVIHHVPAIDSVLTEIDRILKPGGTFMGMVYNKESLLYAYLMYHYGVKEGLVRKMSEEQLISHFSERREGCPYTRAYSIGEFSELLGRHGFTDLEVCVFFNAFDVPGYKRKVKFQFDDKELNMGWHIAFKGNKSK